MTHVAGTVCLSRAHYVTFKTGLLCPCNMLTEFKSGGFHAACLGGQNGQNVVPEMYFFWQKWECHTEAPTTCPLVCSDL